MLKVKNYKWVFLFFVFHFEISYAETFDGNLLLQSCNYFLEVMNNGGRSTNIYNTADQMSGFGACSGYVAGISDMASGYFFCPPSNANYSQYARIVAKYLNNHPEKLNLIPLALVINALSEAFPCPKAKK